MNLVLCNCDPAEADALARAVVEEGLAACVNALPGVVSTYVWEGAIQRETETTLLIKTVPERVDALSERLRALHSYDTPEILVLDVDAARSDPRYVAWVRAVTAEAR